jgi:uncharacterized protein YoxC
VELAAVIFNVGVGLGVLAVGAASVVFVIQSLPLLREARALTVDARRMTALLKSDLPPILAGIRELTASVEVVSEDMAVKLERLNDLLAGLQRTLDANAAASAGAAPYRSAVGSVESWERREEWPEDR